ncbi:MAG: hypothetical protein U9R25_15670 [Chloroflexota bacterium]|nr:hypothetical protein [Chloroflexota bacterium]
MNNRTSSHGQPRISIWSKGLLLLAMMFVLSGCWQHPLAEPLRLVKVGMLRDDSVKLLSERSWYHQECPNRVTIDDLFFFGSQKYDMAVVLIVRSEPDNGAFVVYDIGSFDEANVWHAAYKDCLQRDRFEE